MITFFNNLAKSWVAKLILGLLLASMVLFWGLGGLTNLSTLENEAIKVGKMSLSPYQLTKAFDTERQNIMKMMGGQYISPANAIQAGLLDKVIHKEVAELVQLQIANDLGLTASNEAIKKYVENNPMFQDVIGKFDKNYFYAYLAQTGMSETQLANALEKELAFKHLTTTIQDLGYNPDELVKLSYRFKNESRDVTALKISADKIKINSAPTDEELKDYFEAYSEEFMKPELRHIKLVRLMPDNMSKFITVDPKKVEEIYQSTKDEYNEPEQRDIYQMFFKDEAKANEIASIVNQDNFEKIAQQQLNQKQEETHFGFTKKDQLADGLADPVFALKKGEISKPIQSETGIHLFYVKDIQQAKNASEKEVKEKIRLSLINDEAYTKLEEMTRQLEDVLGEGTSLSEAAQKLGLDIIDIKGLDITGNDINGNSHEAVNQALMQEVYTLNKGDTTSLIEEKNGYLIAQIEEIDPVSVKDFETVKTDVLNLWIKEQQKQAFEKTVDDLTKQAQEGKSLTTLASQNGDFEIITKTDIKRSDAFGELGLVKDTIFNQDLNKVQSNIVKENELAFISVVTKITKADESIDNISFKVEKENQRQFTGTQMALEVVADYTDELGVKINQKIIDKTFSVYKSQD